MSETIANDPIPRRVLMVTCLVSFAGVAFGLLLGLTSNGLTSYETYSLPLLLVASVATFMLLLLTKDLHIVPCGRVMVALWGIYLVSNIANQLYIESIYIAGSLVFGFWLPGYYVLTFVVVEKTFAQRISWSVIAITTAMYLSKILATPPVSLNEDFGLVLAVILLMLQPTIIFLLDALLSYRVRLGVAAAESVAAKRAYSGLLETLTTTESAQHQLRVARDLLDNTIDTITSGIAVFDKQGLLILVNKSLSEACRELGLDMEVGTTNWGSVMTSLKKVKSDSKKMAQSEFWADVLEKQHRQGGGTSQLYLPDGRLFIVYEKQWNDGAFVINLSDVSQLEKSKETISQLQKMDALGRLTGGIAHDFNNLLLIILGNLEIVKNRMETTDASAKLVDQAIAQTNKGAALIRHLLAFARGGNLKMQEVDPAKLLLDLEPMLHSALTGSIKLKYQIQEHDHRIRLESDLLHTMILNIALNARDAMPKGGEFIIGSALVNLDETHIELKGRFVQLTFSDSGEGISDSDLSKVFDPFFTTKAVGQGSGLGLSMVYGLVKQFGGDAKISSELNKGTTVTLWLPALLPKSQSLKTTAIEPVLATFSGKALLVEDNEELMDISKMRLETLGFEVIPVSSIESAENAFRAGEFKLLFCDVILPDGNGYDFSLKAAEQDQEIAILLNSGYTELRSEKSTEKTIQESFAFIQKPHSMIELSEKLKPLLA